MCFATYKLSVYFSYLLLILIKKSFSQSLIILVFRGVKVSMLLMLLSKDDDDSNENVKNKKIVLSRKTTNLHVHHVSLVRFSAVTARLQRENA